MNKKKSLGFTNIQFFLIFAYVVCWLSISTSFEDLIFFYNEIRYLGNNVINIQDIINFLRQFLNVIIFPILLGIFIWNFKKINFRKEIIFILAFLYFIMQIPGLFLSNNSLMNCVFVMSAFNILLIFVIANIYFDEKKKIIFTIISLVMLIVITLLNYKTITNFFTYGSAESLYTFFSSSETFFGKDSPRSTGSSRTFLLILIISLLIFYKFFEKNFFFKIFFYNIVATIILLFQSRTTLVLLLTFIIFNFLYEKKYYINNVSKYLIFYILFPIILLYSTLYLKNIIYLNNLLDSKNINKSSTSENIDKSSKYYELSYFEKFYFLNKNFKRPIDPNTFSSGRSQDWSLILKKMDKSILYGYGSQGDRYLINQTASNGLIYAVSSSGIVGLFFFISFSLYFLLIVFKNLILERSSSLKKNYLSSLVIFLILLRSILESSYAVFSVDFIIIFTFINFLNKFNTKENNVD